MPHNFFCCTYWRAQLDLQNPLVSYYLGSIDCPFPLTEQKHRESNPGQLGQKREWYLGDTPLFPLTKPIITFTQSQLGTRDLKIPTQFSLNSSKNSD